MQWYKYFSWGERWNVPFNNVKPSWMEHLIFHQMKLFVPLHEWENIHYLFDITCIKIQIFKKIEKKNNWKTILAQEKH